ncbi:MAG: hypothetical protein C4K60_01680 [Ideonella sp. MAG2]|nr:MAG: hypothetical protein C4K60_01680 [Ideonella sp. MAG2]
MKPVIVCALGCLVATAWAQPCEPAAPVAQVPRSKAQPAAQPPAVRLRLELRDSLPGPTAATTAATTVSSRAGAGRPVLTLWTDNNQAIEARLALQTSGSTGELQWLWSAQQGVVVSPQAAAAPQPAAARWWFCPTWPGGAGSLSVRYETPASEAGPPALKGQISVPLDEWVPLWAPPPEPPATGGDTVWRSTQAATPPRLEMRWRRD